jgi:RNA polymerase sigma factor (TIGR02999 family)
MNQTPQITGMLHRWCNGNHEALDKLTSLADDKLPRQVARYLRRKRHNHTLQTTALIHEADIILIDPKKVNWENRAHFCAIYASLMRRILVDQARGKHRQKHGGNALTLSTVGIDKKKTTDLIEVNKAPNHLEEVDE